MCICECHRACPVFGREPLSGDDWLNGCTCLGATSRKEIHVEVRAESDQRKALTNEAVAEVRALDPKGRDQILQAFEDAYEKRGLELSDLERKILPDAIEATHKPRPQRDIEGLKLLGRLGTGLVKEIRGAFARDKVVDPSEEHYNDVVDLARSLGDAGREDQDAVGELRELAGAGGADLLVRAAETFSVADRSMMDEYDNWDLSYRLLWAAATSGTIEPVPAERAEFFREVWALETAPAEEGWARLVAIQPALTALEDEIRTRAAVQEPLLDRLARLVGPTAKNVPDPILTTRTAKSVVEKHLGVVFKNSSGTA
jgi:hypothetical protein